MGEEEKRAAEIRVVEKRGRLSSAGGRAPE